MPPEDTKAPPPDVIVRDNQSQQVVKISCSRFLGTEGAWLISPCDSYDPCLTTPAQCREVARALDAAADWLKEVQE